MKVLIISDGIGTSTGVTSVSRFLAKFLLSNGHQACSFARLPYKRVVEEEDEPLLKNVVEFQPGSISRDDRENAFTTMLEHEKPDVIYSGLDIWYSGFFVKKSSEMNIPVVLHPPIDSEPYMSKIDIGIGTLVETSAVLSEVTKLVVFGEFGRRSIEHIRNPDAIIPLPVDSMFFTPPTVSFAQRAKIKSSLYSCNPERFVFLSVGINQRRKGFDRLLEAYAKLPKHLHNAVKLVIKTNTPSSILGFDMIELAKRLNISADRLQIIATDNYTSASMAALYRFADAFVLFSRAEGWGLPFIEAMSSGLPVICGPHGGHTDFIKNGMTGIVAKASDSFIVEGSNWKHVLTSTSDAASKMVKVCTNQNVYQKLAQAGRNVATSLDGDIVFGPKILAVLEEASKQRGKLYATI